MQTIIHCAMAAILTLGVPAKPATSVPPGLNLIALHGQTYLTRTVDPAKEDLRLFWRDAQENQLRDFTGLQKQVQVDGQRLLFAANAGMFEPDAKPVGLLVQNGVEQNPLNLQEGTGNFYLKPNGIFVISENHHAQVIESSTYPDLLSPAVWATQSGPLMVQAGNIHPDFIESSKNKKLRSGVGIRKDGVIVFAISQTPVTFYDFASLFLNQLGCSNALYLDGDISAFWVPGTSETSGQHTFTAMFGLVEKAPQPISSPAVPTP